MWKGKRLPSLPPGLDKLLFPLRPIELQVLLNEVLPRIRDRFFVVKHCLEPYFGLGKKSSFLTQFTGIPLIGRSRVAIKSIMTA